MSAAGDLRELSIEELRGKVKDLRQELFNLRFQLVTHQLENVSRIRSVRRSIARLKTVIHEKAAVAGKEQGVGA